MSTENVWVDGSFEMVHFGDLYQLREAKKFGKSVVVGLHSDGEIMRNSGYPPVFNENERYRLLSNAKFVDKVVKNAPYRTSLAVMDRNNCHYCGKNAFANDDARFDEVRKAGRLVETKSAFEISTKDINERVLKFHSALQRGTAMHLPWQNNTFLATSETFKLLACGAKPENDDKIVYTCGTFDFFNVGHLAFLEKAKTFGDYLILGIYTDEDVIQSKGYHPIMSLYERVLSAFAYKVVDEIVIGAPLVITDELIDRFKIDVIVEGRVGTAHKDYFSIPRKRGIYRMIDSGSTVTTETVLRRIIESRIKGELSVKSVLEASACKNDLFKNHYKSHYPVEQLG